MIGDTWNNVVRKINLCAIKCNAECMPGYTEAAPSSCDPDSYPACVSNTTVHSNTHSNTTTPAPTAATPAGSAWLMDSVIQAFGPHAACNETRSWVEISAENRAHPNRENRYVSGGLGSLTTSTFGLWVCWRDHPCVGAVGAAAGDRMCYVMNKVTDGWHPWGLNSALGLCSYQ
mmetsp:Transcript_32756/g.64008  ORF Transcript_32756/g.64008 Transcript_32756/m.64008 type:complete len:174 (-) Transcript_32756:191-712(-)